ncbi:MAG: SLBB domain-containing protein, partial [Spirochaetota bacterium]
MYRKALKYSSIFIFFIVLILNSLYGENSKVSASNDSNQPQVEINDSSTGKLSDSEKKDKELFFGIPLPLEIIPKDDTKILQGFINTNEYILTPGDIYEITMYIPTYTTKPEINIVKTELILASTYILQVPQIGEINVKNLTFNELKKFIVDKIRKTMSAHFVDYTLISPGHFEVFINGGVKKPGIIIANSFTRLGEAISLAGGLNLNSSYRTIEIKHADGSVSTV